MIDPPEKVGQRLKRLRVALGYHTQVAFAAEIGVEKNTYNPWEKGSRELTFEGACLIRKRFRIPLDYLFFGQLMDELPSSVVKKLRDVA
jgi:transcriptional regulator with XRE-family HTH domain